MKHYYTKITLSHGKNTPQVDAIRSAWAARLKSAAIHSRRRMQFGNSKQKHRHHTKESLAASEASGVGNSKHVNHSLSIRSAPSRHSSSDNPRPTNDLKYPDDDIAKRDVVTNEYDVGDEQ